MTARTNGTATKTAARNGTKPRLRLLKVIVQPVFAIDDGTTLIERAAEPLVVTPADWPDYPARLAVEMTAMEQQLAIPLDE